MEKNANLYMYHHRIYEVDTGNKALCPVSQATRRLSEGIRLTQCTKALDIRSEKRVHAETLLLIH